MGMVWMQNLTSEEIGIYLQSECTVIVPIGSTESHGRHLPLGTDSYEAIDYAEGIAERAGVLCTPPIWFGDSPHHMGQPGTISLRSETVIAVLRDVYRSLIRHGFKRIITFNGHRIANLPVIGIAAKAVKEKYPEVLFAAFDPVYIAAEAHKRIRTKSGEAIHGGEFETSHMLFKHPDLVHPEKFERNRGVYIDSSLVNVDHFAGGDSVMWITTWHDQIVVAPAGHHGDPTAASVETGAAIFEAVVANGVRFIEDMRRHSGPRANV